MEGDGWLQTIVPFRSVRIRSPLTGLPSVFLARSAAISSTDTQHGAADTQTGQWPALAPFSSFRV